MIYMLIILCIVCVFIFLYTGIIGTQQSRQSARCKESQSTDELFGGCNYTRQVSGDDCGGNGERRDQAITRAIQKRGHQ